MSNKSRQNLMWFLIVVGVFVVDIATKQMAEAMLEYGQGIPVLPVLDFTLLYNPGAAFSFLASESGWQRWLFTGISSVVSLILMVWLYRLEKNQMWLGVALALILGGALGNLFDRIAFGHVIDFIAVHWDDAYFPAFNIADSAITVGAIMLGIDAIRDSIQESKNKPDSESC